MTTRNIDEAGTWAREGYPGRTMAEIMGDDHRCPSYVDCPLCGTGVYNNSYFERYANSRRLIAEFIAKQEEDERRAREFDALFEKPFPQWELWLMWQAFVGFPFGGLLTWLMTLHNNLSVMQMTVSTLIFMLIIGTTGWASELLFRMTKEPQEEVRTTYGPDDASQLQESIPAKASQYKSKSSWSLHIELKRKVSEKE